MVNRAPLLVAALSLLLACDLRPLAEHLDGGPVDGARDSASVDAGDGPVTHDGSVGDGPVTGDAGAGICPGKPLHQTPDPDKMTGWYTSIAVAPGGEVHISHRAVTPGKPRYARWSGGAWKNETVQATGMAGLNTALALGPGGTVHLVHYDLDVSRFRYTQRTTSGWSAPETISAAHLGGADLAVDSAGVVHLVTYGKLSSEIIYLRREANAWKSAVVLEASGDTAGPKPGLVIRGGTVHVSLCAKGGVLKYLTGAGDVFAPQTLVTAGLGKYCNTDLAVDGDGDAHIVYLNSDARTLHYIGQTKGTFGAPRKIADVAGSVGLSNAINATPAGDLWLTYFNGTTASLELMRRKGGVWDPKPQLVAPQAGRYLSADLDPQSALHIAHWSTYTTKLVYTRVCP